MPLSRAIAVLLLALGVAVGHLAHRQVDETRVISLEQELQVIPSGSTLRIAASGLHVQVADLMWMRTVLEFGARITGDEGWNEWLARSLVAVTELDPHWRTPFFYGGTMVRVAGSVDGSTDIFERGAVAFPQDPYFPFSVGMNYYFEGDKDKAADWVERASKLPGAPGWYAGAATAFHTQERSSEQVLHYLDEELAHTTDPKLREALEALRVQTLHDVYSEGMNGLGAQFEQSHQRRPSPEDLLSSGMMSELPPDPLGGTWVVDVDGLIYSDRRVEAMVERDHKLERKMLRSWVEVDLPEKTE